MSSRTTERARPVRDHDALERLLRGVLDDPYAVLGMHATVTDRVVVRCLLPGAMHVEVIEREAGCNCGELARIEGELFAGTLDAPHGPFAYRLRITDGHGVHVRDDPYAFPPLLGDLDCHLLAEGRHWNAYDCLGAHPRVIDGIAGTAFAVWAPNAQRVSVVGPFNDWDGRVHVMRRRIECGVWEIFLPGVGVGALYKYELRTPEGALVLKADPYAFRSETPPATASVVAAEASFAWTDAAWMQARAQRAPAASPVSIYEVHLGSWRRHPDGRPCSYRELADRLIPYACDMGFTHLELLPVNEHPFGGS